MTRRKQYLRAGDRSARLRDNLARYSSKRGERVAEERFAPLIAEATRKQAAAVRRLWWGSSNV